MKKNLLLLSFIVYSFMASAQCKPVITANGPTQFCSGGSVMLTSYIDTLTDFSYQWYHDFNAISGANGKDYIVTLNGSYYCQIMNWQCPGSINSFDFYVSVIAIPVASIQ